MIRFFLSLFGFLPVDDCVSESCRRQIVRIDGLRGY